MDGYMCVRVLEQEEDVSNVGHECAGTRSKAIHASHIKVCHPKLGVVLQPGQQLPPQPANVDSHSGGDAGMQGLPCVHLQQPQRGRRARGIAVSAAVAPALVERTAAACPLAALISTASLSTLRLPQTPVPAARSR